MARHIRKILITPELADQMLSRRKDGQIRRFKKHHAQALMDRFKREGYRESNDLMSVDTDNDTSNGQHRLWAIRELGISVWQHVIFEAPLSEFDVTDTHLPRDRETHFRIAGIPNAKYAASAMMFSMQYIHGRFRRGAPTFLRSRVNEGFMIDLYRRSSLIQDSVQTMVSASKRKMLGAAGCFFKAVMSTIDIELWDDFFRKINGDLPTSRQDVEFQLRAQLEKTGIYKIHEEHRDALVITAWNYRVANRKVKILHWSKEKQGFPDIDGNTPERFAKLANLPIIPEYVLATDSRTVRSADKNSSCSIEL